MQRIKTYSFIIVLLLMTNTCIEPYLLHIAEDDLNKYVISGQVTDQEGYQYVSVALGSSLDNPGFIPLQDCKVVISDDKGNEFILEEIHLGQYRVWIDKEYLNPGTSYRLAIETPSRVNIISDFDKMPECPDVDSVYYINEEVPTYDPDNPLQGIQFYINLQAGANHSRFYRWELEETWEYHAEYAKTYYYDGFTNHTYSPPDSSEYYCWKTEKINDIFTLSTESLVENRYSMLPLNYVDNRSSRLDYGYSLLVRQYAISDSAYYYWDKLKVNSSNEGGLYEQQPLHVVGNLKNVTHPELDVLGFFSTSSVKEKRFFGDSFDIETEYLDCLEYKLDAGDYESGNPFYYHFRRIWIGAPANAWVNAGFLLSGICIDCTSEGGTIVKPDFWPY